MRLPRVAVTYILTVVLGSLVIAVLYLFGSSDWPSDVGTVELAGTALLFTLAAFLADMYPIAMPSTNLFESHNELVLSSSVYVAALLLFGPAFTIPVAAASVLLSDLWRRKPLYKAAFNSGQYVMTVGISGLFLLGRHATPDSFAPWLTTGHGLVTLLLMLPSYFLLNGILITEVVATTQGTRFIDLWKHGVPPLIPQYAGMLNVGLVAAILWTVSPYAVVLLAIPLMLVHLASKSVVRLRLETEEALIRIAGVVDSRDSYAYRHSQEVARYATQIAVKMGLRLDDVDMIKLAAQLHDIGKIGTPDQVLHKPGPLTEDERAVMEDHPSVGASMLEYFSQFRDGVGLVLHHQEHFDGSGYPSGLAGQGIPLGARIIHVADAYQAMTSDRVYRKALPTSEAVRRLVAGSGSQFDPDAVKALIEVLRDTGVQMAVIDPGGLRHLDLVVGNR